MSGPFYMPLQRLTAYTVGRFSFLILVTNAMAAHVSADIRASFVFNLWRRPHLRNARTWHISAPF